MLIQIIEDNAEEKCIETLEEISNSSVNRNLLQCCFSGIGLKPEPDDILPLVKDILNDKDASLFFCKDGDVFVRWSGYPKATLEALHRNIRACYERHTPESLQEAFFKYYDVHAHGEEARLECRNKLKKNNEAQHELQEDKKPEPPQKIITGFNEQMLKALQGNLMARGTRKDIKILIVEDQLFSRKLLVAAIGHDYQCHVADNASKALMFYALHAPDIVFLDIELPDMDGHTLAGLFGEADPGSYIVMVTGNHYADDIEKAKKNKVKGFVVKPYNKQKILDSINKFYEFKRTP